MNIIDKEATNLYYKVSISFKLKKGCNIEVKSAYIHIPFCVRICTYCDFNKYFIDKQPVDEYIAALIKEMSFSKTKQLETMYVEEHHPLH